MLLVGLARTGQMEPATALAWIKAAANQTPKRDTKLAAQTFLEYKAAQAGELDWRPTETVPEDFYAL